MEQFLLRNKKGILIGILVLFGLLFGILSIGNHLCFRTYGLDLGSYTHASYNYAHLRSNDCSFFLWEPRNLLSDHFDLYLILFSPFIYLFGEYTLLVIQIVFVLLGAFGVYKLTGLYTRSSLIQLIAPLLLLLSFGIWSAVGSDYHSNVPSAMLLPWLLYFIKKEKLVMASVMVVAIIIAKETQPLWIFCVLLALLWDYRKEVRIRRWLLWNMLGTTLYAVVVMLFIMPALGTGSSPGFWRYQWMGQNFKEMALWILSHPWQSFVNLFTDFTAGGGFSVIKTEFYICALLSGLFFTFFKPNYLLMIIPPLCLKMYSLFSDAFWGINCHYNIEICVVIGIASAIVLAQIPAMEEKFRIQNSKFRLSVIVPVLALIMTAGTLHYTIDEPYTNIHREQVNLFDDHHYRQTEFDAELARHMLKQIPGDASVCATTMFTPHLATREKCHIFPISIGSDDYYLLLKHHWCYYEGEEELVAQLIADTTHYECIDTDGMLFLLMRK